MGFIDKIKEEAYEAISRVTGRNDNGNLTVTLNKDEILPGESLILDVKIEALKDLKVNRFVLRLREIETTNMGLGKYSVAEKVESKTSGSKPVKYTAYMKEYQVLDDFYMRKGESRIISATVEFPKNAKTTYVGTTISHEWEIEAFLDIKGGGNLSQRVKIPVVASVSQTSDTKMEPVIAPVEESMFEVPSRESGEVQGSQPTTQSPLGPLES